MSLIYPCLGSLWGEQVFSFVFRVAESLFATRVFHDGYADDEKFIASSISFDTIQSLYNILLDFTSTTVHRAISLREQEVILKRKIKVWRLDKEDKVSDFSRPAKL